MSMRLGLGLGLPGRGLAATAWIPASLFTASEQGAWYDPSDLSTVWQNSAGTTPGAIDSPVGRIDDKSGNANHATQATSAARPILRQTAGGLYYLEGDGVDDLLQSGTTLTLSPPCFIIAGLERGSSSGTSYMATFGLVVGSSDFAQLRVRPSIDTPAFYTRGAALGIGQVGTTGVANEFPAATAIVHGGLFQAGSQDCRINGAIVNTGVNAWAPSNSISGARVAIPMNAVFTRKFFGGVVLDRLPTGDEITKMTEYLATKSGVTL